MNPLQVPAFRTWMSVRSFTMTAVQVQTTAVGWWVYDATGDPLDLAWVGLAQFVPILVLALPAGQLADRYDRRWLLASCYVLHGTVNGVFAALAATGHASTSTVVALCVAVGVSRAFGNPAGQAITPSLVPAPSLSRAMAMSSILFQAATVGGPSLAGLMLATGSAVPAFVISSVLMLIASTLVLRLPAPRTEPKHVTWQTLLAGVRYVVEHKVVLGCTSLDLFAVLLGGATALLPVYATDILHAGPRGYGLLRAAPAVGAAAVALLLATRPIERSAGLKMFTAVFVFGLATLVFGLSRSFPLSLFALAVLGGADMVSVVVRQTLVQVSTPDEMRGRVSAVNLVFISASNELGEFESGLTARLFGAVQAVVIGAVGTMGVTLAWAGLFPELRKADRMG
ncbi:MAG: MFS transporter [Myxococcales bacterium]|nr:MFS transporter [Myxococcales bacterium]